MPALHLLLFAGASLLKIPGWVHLRVLRCSGDHFKSAAVPVPVMQNAGRSIGAINPVGMSNSVALKTAIAESAALHAQREVRAFADTVYKKKVDGLKN